MENHGKVKNRKQLTISTFISFFLLKIIEWCNSVLPESISVCHMCDLWARRSEDSYKSGAEVKVYCGSACVWVQGLLQEQQVLFTS